MKNGAYSFADALFDVQERKNSIQNSRGYSGRMRIETLLGMKAQEKAHELDIFKTRVQANKTGFDNVARIANGVGNAGVYVVEAPFKAAGFCLRGAYKLAEGAGKLIVGLAPHLVNAYVANLQYKLQQAQQNGQNQQGQSGQTGSSGSPTPPPIPPAGNYVYPPGTPPRHFNHASKSTLDDITANYKDAMGNPRDFFGHVQANLNAYPSTQGTRVEDLDDRSLTKFACIYRLRDNMSAQGGIATFVAASHEWRNRGYDTKFDALYNSHPGLGCENLFKLSTS